MNRFKTTKDINVSDVLRLTASYIDVCFRCYVGYIKTLLTILMVFYIGNQITFPYN